jgi:hypothetical protein
MIGLCITKYPTINDRDSILDICRVRKLGDGGRDGKGGKGWKLTYILCIASVQNILATSVLV